MQSQVNYLLSKDCERDIKKQQRKVSIACKENAKKGHASRKSMM
jgi:hypothetical protein